MKRLSLWFCLFSVTALSCNDNLIEKKQIDGVLVEAQFNKKNLIEGPAFFFDLNNKLKSKANFIGGVKNGIATTYYLNGKIQDSMYYFNDLLHDKVFSYDSSGFLLSIITHFFGLRIGDNTYYIKNKAQNYYFTNFEHEHLVKCDYDELGRCVYLKFNAKPLIYDVTNENSDSAIGLFLYFPHPPGFEISYKMGFIDSKQNRQNEFYLNTNRLFLDTIVKTPPKGLKYFLAVDYKNLSNDTLVNQLFESF